MASQTIILRATIQAPAQQVWKLWTETVHVKQWNSASEDWHTPSAKNDLRPGGRFVYRMQARDGSEGFDFTGVYHEVVPCELLSYTLDDERYVRVSFSQTKADVTQVMEAFEAEETNDPEVQRAGWQAILDRFKRYVEEEYPALERGS